MPEKATVTDALAPNDPLSKVIFFGAKLKRDLKDELVSASIDSSTDQVTQLELTFADPALKKMKTGLYKPKIPVQFEDYALEVAAVTISEDKGTEHVTVKCRPRVVRKLKNRRGRKVMKAATPSEFVIAECKAVGAKYVVQPSTKRRQIARDVKGAKDAAENDVEPSSWTTFQRLAGEVGFVVFEQAGTIYFGKPSWLMKNSKTSPLIVNWRTGSESTWPHKTPDCSKSSDSKTTTIDLDLPIHMARAARVGRALQLNGVPGFNGLYLINKTNYPLINATSVTVSASTPEDPDPLGWKKPGRRSTGSGGSGLSGVAMTNPTVRQVCDYVGFSGDGLEIAIAVVMAESGGDATAQGDEHLANSKWGNSVGLFQIRSLRNPSAYSGNDRLRNATKLRDAIYNASTAYKISAGGTSWGAWSTYTSGAYKAYYKTGKSYTVKNWNPPAGTGGGGEGSTGRRGTKSASDFAAFALQQAGDRYVFGAEASKDDRDPDVFDCSELVEWAAAQVGVFIPDGSANQIAFCSSISVESAIRTRGTLLYKPGHIAISLGNGQTIEALNPGYGVRQMSATDRSFRWTAAGKIPGMIY